MGALLPTGQKISKGKLRGVPSNGMMCSAGELKLDIEGLPEEQLNDKIAEYAEYIKLIILALLLAAVVYYIVKRLTKNKKHDSL